jgi:hypothetical protein
MYNLQESWIKYRINTQWVSRSFPYKQKLLAFKVCFKNRHYYPHFFKACGMRIGELLLPSSRSQKILQYIKSK